MLRILLFASAVVSSTAFMEVFFHNFNNTCKEHEFFCTNSQCIPSSRRCDGHNDCMDGSDEEDCDFVLCEMPHFFRCENTRCISSSFICDGENDCSDYSDEKNCSDFQIIVHGNTTCEKGFWQCSDNLCIPEDWVCNNETDCPDGSDEILGCSAKINCDDGFKCNNGHCIPNEWRCDGKADCRDDSDEQNCENHTDPRLCIWDNNKFLCANNKTCINLNVVCDGFPHCPDKSDESPLCNSTTNDCKHHNCSHGCIQLPDGPKCTCPAGYTLDGRFNCTDINECETYGICDQKCKNTMGSYECLCDHKYILQSDGHTCKVVNGDAMMMFSSNKEIRGYLLGSDTYISIIKDLFHGVGVTYDGNYVYWTDILAENECLMRAKEDGTSKETLLTSGLGLPEALAIDWLTNNIYFTDVERQHIGVCTNDGTHCTVLVNKDIRKPRAIVLNVNDGDMYWTDWGEPSEIGYSSMDGSNHKSFVSKDIYWPNGLALDYPSGRLYWTDARKTSLESIRLDGTDRRMILHGIVKHPFAIAVFENRLYWSDWSTHSIQSCDKFTGKDHHTIVKDNQGYIYGLSVFHSAMMSRIENPCAFAFCSDICLLNGPKNYTCACPEFKELDEDRHTCRTIGKKQMLVIGAGNILLHLEHQTLGKHDITPLTAIAKNIGALAYNSVNNSLFISDLDLKQIILLNMNNGNNKLLKRNGIEKVISMDFDHLGNNLYWCDEGKGTVEVMNLFTKSEKVLLHDMNGELPRSIVVIPEEGVMFVALHKKSAFESHIDRFYLDGSGRTHFIEDSIQGPVSLHFDYDLYRLFFADRGRSIIETISLEGDDRHKYRSLQSEPVCLTALKSSLFWITYDHMLYWTDKKNPQTFSKKIFLKELPPTTDPVHIVSISPKTVKSSVCQLNNGNCSHLCLISRKDQTICACPVGMELDSTNHTCIKRVDCTSNEFHCYKSNTCILNNLQCNGHKDCPNGEDELECLVKHHCPPAHFQCSNGQCIDEDLRCDHHYDCRDKSDEHGCEFVHKENVCPPDHLECDQNECIPNRFVCDGVNDCVDMKDEQNCLLAVCKNTQFRCGSGSCIPKSWECDHEFDCPDLSDEHADCKYPECPSTAFKCTNGKCLDSSLRCDFNNDCGDNSDEINCDKLDPSMNCNKNEFACTSNTSICVPLLARCDGISDCPHKEDEANCSSCHVDDFTCANKHCISLEWICDHVNDCGDNSDESEALCWHNINVTSHSVPCPDGFRCNNGDCIEYKKVCNGKHDCYDGSDEGGRCTEGCKPKINPCEHECQTTPTGPVCKCKSGYKLAGDGHRCLDIDECKTDPPICSQLCFNHQGNYTCDCYNGFLLRSDRKTCKAEGDPVSMIFTSNNQIRMLDQKTNRLSVLYNQDSPPITGLNMHYNANLVYFTIQRTGTLHRVNIATGERTFMEHVGQPQKIAIEWSTGNIYYVDEATKSISICGFDEKGCVKLIDIDVNMSVGDLVIDSYNKVLFYSVTSWWVFKSPSSIIYKCNLDGSGKQELFKTTIGYITGITLDVYKQQLYYIDQHQDKIMRVNYNGLKNVQVFAGVARPLSISFFENRLLYLTSTGIMNKCKLYDTQDCESFKLQTYSNEMFVLVQQSLQPHVENVCNTHNCSHICIPKQNNGFKCLCEDGNVISHKDKCEMVQFELHSKALHFRAEEKTSKNHAGLATGILVCMLVFVTGLGMYCMMRRRNQGRFNVSIKFQNPMYNQQLNEENDVDAPILQPGQHEYSNPVHFGSESSNFLKSK